MNLRAQCFICENNTPSTAMGGIVFDDLRDIQITTQMTTLNLGGHLKTGVIMEAYAGGQFVEVFGQLPLPVDNCDRGLRLILMLIPQSFYDSLLMPMLQRICEVTNRPMPQLFEDGSASRLHFG